MNYNNHLQNNNYNEPITLISKIIKFHNDNKFIYLIEILFIITVGIFMYEVHTKYLEPIKSFPNNFDGITDYQYDFKIQE